MPLSLRWGHVTAITERLDGLVRCEVDGNPCVAYTRLTGPVEEGDTVIVNSQARELGLGSGGFDILYANLTRGLSLAATEGAHVMTLPYTPGQVAFRMGEEGATLPEGLEAMPVVCCGLHSQLAPVCAALCRSARRVRPARGRGAAGVALRHRPRAARPSADRGRDRGCAVLRRRHRLRQRRVGALVGEGEGSRRRGVRDRPRHRRHGYELRSRGPRGRGGGNAAAALGGRAVVAAARLEPRHPRASPGRLASYARRTPALPRRSQIAWPADLARRRLGRSLSRPSTSTAGTSAAPGCRSRTWVAIQPTTRGSSRQPSLPGALARGLATANVDEGG